MRTKFRTLRSLAVVVVFGLIAIACSSGSATDVSAAPEAVADVAEDSVGEPVEDDEPEETPTTQAAETTTTATPDEEADTAEPAESTTTTAAPETTTTSTTTTTTTAAPVAPLFQGDFVDLNGQTVSLADFQGEDVVLWFWAPW